MRFPVQIPWFTLEDVASGQSVWCRRGDWRKDDPRVFYISNRGGVAFEKPLNRVPFVSVLLLRFSNVTEGLLSGR